MLEPVRTKAERQRQGEESGNRVSTSTKNRQRAGRGRAEAATGRAAQDLGRREAATLTKWARWALRLPLYKNDAAWSLFLISDRIVPTLFPHLASRNSLNFRQGVKLHFRLSEGGSFPVLACAIFAETRYISSTILSRRCRFRAQPR